VLPIEKLINDMRADVLERRKAPTYIKATRKWVEAELREAADIEWEANRIEKAWLETKRELDKVVA
jgi:transcriptional regulator NrdR family protein